MWKGEGGEKTWEPLENLESAKGMIEEFNSKLLVKDGSRGGKRYQSLKI